MTTHLIKSEKKTTRIILVLKNSLQLEKLLKTLKNIKFCAGKILKYNGKMINGIK